jgi:hypothetical protein
MIVRITEAEPRGHILGNPDHWRARAEEACTIAEQLTDHQQRHRCYASPKNMSGSPSMPRRGRRRRTRAMAERRDSTVPRPPSFAAPFVWAAVMSVGTIIAVVADAAMTARLVLKCASASRPSGQWNDDDYDVIADGKMVGRIFLSTNSPPETPWMWTLAYGYHKDRTPTHGYEATREAAMAAFAKSWHRQ